MIKKLQTKFIVIAMVSMALVLIAILCGVNVANFVRVNARSDEVIAMLAKGGGEFPSPVPDKPWGVTDETPYMSRYFTVTFTPDGENYKVAVNLRHIASVAGQDAIEMAQNAFNGQKAGGMDGDFKFTSIKLTPPRAGTMYIFLDCSAELNTFRTFLWMSAVISAGGLVIVFLLVLFLSHLAIKPALQSYKLQKNFITNAGHDIKTPLSVISAVTDVIEIENGESEYTREIKNQIARLTELTDKLVLLSKTEEAQEYAFEPFDISAVLEEALAPYCLSARAKNSEIEADIESGIIYKGSEQAIKTAFCLLLDNAVKYTSGGAIKLHLKKSGRGISFAISNRAEGLEAGSHDELFERFYRGDEARTSQGGNGIGLSVVRAVVQMHEGKIDATSDGESLEIAINL